MAEEMLGNCRVEVWSHNKVLFFDALARSGSHLNVYVKGLPMVLREEVTAGCIGTVLRLAVHKAVDLEGPQLAEFLTASTTYQSSRAQRKLT